MPRNERFTADYQYRIQNLLQTLTPNIIQKQREMPRETKIANQSLAMFVKVTKLKNFQLIKNCDFMKINLWKNSYEIIRYNHSKSISCERKKTYDYYKGIFQELVHFVNMVDVKIYCIVHMVMWSDMLKGHIFKEQWNWESMNVPVYILSQCIVHVVAFNDENRMIWLWDSVSPTLL